MSDPKPMRVGVRLLPAEDLNVEMQWKRGKVTIGKWTEVFPKMKPPHADS